MRSPILKKQRVVVTRDLIIYGCHLTLPYATELNFLSTCSQDGQTKMNCSKRAPSFGIVRRCCMVSPHEGHTRTGVLSGTSAEHSMAGIEGV